MLCWACVVTTPTRRQAAAAAAADGHGRGPLTVASGASSHSSGGATHGVVWYQQPAQPSLPHSKLRMPGERGDSWTNEGSISSASVTLPLPLPLGLAGWLTRPPQPQPSVSHAHFALLNR